MLLTGRPFLIVISQVLIVQTYKIILNFQKGLFLRLKMHNTSINRLLSFIIMIVNTLTLKKHAPNILTNVVSIGTMMSALFYIQKSPQKRGRINKFFV